MQSLPTGASKGVKLFLSLNLNAFQNRNPLSLMLQKKRIWMVLYARFIKDHKYE